MMDLSFGDAMGTALQDAYNSTPGMARMLMPQPSAFMSLDDFGGRPAQAQLMPQQQQPARAPTQQPPSQPYAGSTPVQSLHLQPQPQPQTSQPPQPQLVARQQAQAAKAAAVAAPVGAADPSYADRLWGKRRDMVKSVGLALAVLLAITTFSLLDFWIKELTVSQQLPFRHELGLRAAVPLAVAALLWNVKAFRG